MLLCLTQLCIMLVFINYSAVLPLLKDEWQMSNTMAGSIFSVYQLGYIISGVLLSTLADRFSSKKIFIVSAIWSGIANILFAVYAHDYTSAMILRALTGIGMGGTYMPGLKLVAERFPSNQRGKAIGIYVGSLVMGASLSLLITGTITSLTDWRTAFVCCSIGVFLGVVLSFAVFKGYRFSPDCKQPDETYMTAVVKNRPAMLMILGYGSHMWEMYGMRSWLAPFFTATLIQYGFAGGKATGWGATASALIVGVGAFSTAITGGLSRQNRQDENYFHCDGGKCLHLPDLRLADQRFTLAHPCCWRHIWLPDSCRIAGIFDRADRTGHPGLSRRSNGNPVTCRLFTRHDLANGIWLGAGYLQGVGSRSPGSTANGGSVLRSAASVRWPDHLHVLVEKGVSKRPDGFR